MSMPRPRKRQPKSTIAIGYIRRSTSRQDLSPEAQRAGLEQWCEGNGAELASVHEETASGSKDLHERPGLLAAVEEVALRGAGVLLVARRDRLARDPYVAMVVERQLAKVGARVITADGTGNGDSPTDAFLRQTLDAASALERALNRARTKAALQAKKRRGERVGTLPYGKHLGADGVHLEDDAAELAVIDRVATLRAKGTTIRAIAEGLNEEGHRPRSGRLWGIRGVYRIIRRLEDEGRLVAYPKAAAA